MWSGEQGPKEALGHRGTRGTKGPGGIALGAVGRRGTGQREQARKGGVRAARSQKGILKGTTAAIPGSSTWEESKLAT